MMEVHVELFIKPIEDVFVVERSFDMTRTDGLRNLDRYLHRTHRTERFYK